MNETITLPQWLTSSLPAPTMYSVSTTVTLEGGTDIRIAQEHAGPIIASISGDSLLRFTSIKVGQIILSVNGYIVTDAEQATALIRRVSPGKPLTLIACDAPKTPYYKVIPAPRLKGHPGLSFAPTRGHCLVQVSRVFERGPFGGNGALKPGDIVLAVNGVPVSKTEQADRALRTAARDGPITLIYAIDVSRLCRRIFKEANLYGMKLIQVGRSNNYNLVLPGEVNVPLQYNFETQQLGCPSGVQPDLVSLNLDYVSKFKSHAVPFMKRFNRLMEKEMLNLEEEVCCAVWNFQLSRGQRLQHHFDDSNNCAILLSKTNRSPLVNSQSSRAA